MATLMGAGEAQLPVDWSAGLIRWLPGRQASRGVNRVEEDGVRELWQQVQRFSFL